MEGLLPTLEKGIEDWEAMRDKIDKIMTRELMKKLQQWESMRERIDTIITREREELANLKRKILQKLSNLKLA